MKEAEQSADVFESRDAKHFSRLTLTRPDDEFSEKNVCFMLVQFFRISVGKKNEKTFSTVIENLKPYIEGKSVDVSIKSIVGRQWRPLPFSKMLHLEVVHSGFCVSFSPPLSLSLALLFQ